MLAPTLGRLALCILLETARQALPILVKVAVQKCLERKDCKEVQ